MITSEIAKILIDVAKSENEILAENSKYGIFHMPELAFAYECGKKIMFNSNRIFGHHQVDWLREADLGNGGPTDLVIRLDTGQRIAIEFKMRDTGEAYLKDVKKLSRLDDATLKIFCALIDVFDTKLPDDGRQNLIENSEYKIRVIKKSTFITKQNWYVGSVSCVACVWSVGSVPALVIN